MPAIFILPASTFAECCCCTAIQKVFIKQIIHNGKVMPGYLNRNFFKLLFRDSCFNYNTRCTLFWSSGTSSCLNWIVLYAIVCCVAMDAPVESNPEETPGSSLCFRWAIFFFSCRIIIVGVFSNEQRELNAFHYVPELRMPLRAHSGRGGKSPETPLPG